MQFNHMKITKCPECGCDTVISEGVDYSYGKVQQHCNGQQWEQRSFLCGVSFKWIPNFCRAEPQSHCRNTPEWKAKESKRAALRIQIDALQDELRKI